MLIAHRLNLAYGLLYALEVAILLRYEVECSSTRAAAITEVDIGGELTTHKVGCEDGRCALCSVGVQHTCGNAIADVYDIATPLCGVLRYNCAEPRKKE